MLVSKLNKIVVYYLLILSFPFYIVGISLFNYPLNVSFLLICLLSIFVLIQRKFNRNIIFSFLTMIIWFFVNTVFRVNVFKFLPSLILFILVLFPLLDKNTIGDLNKFKVDKLLKLSFYIVTGFWIYQYIAFFIGLPRIDNLFPLSVDIQYFWTSSIKIPRFSSFFREPSHMVVYLITIHVLVEKEYTSYSKSVSNFIRIISAFMIGAMISLSGIIILLTYYIIIFLRKFWQALIENRIKRIYINTIIAISSTFLLLLVLYYSSTIDWYNKVVDSFVVRINKVESVVKGSNKTGSEAVRLNVVGLANEYYESEGVVNFLIGEGFAQHDNWVRKQAGETYQEGNIQNTFIIIFLSTGVIGLSLFLLFIFTIYKSYHLSFEFQIVSLLIFFFSGYLIIYLNWLPILIFAIYSLKNES